MPPEHHETQPSAEIVRVERTKRRRECDLVLSGATLCGDRARRVREMQARVRFVPVRDNPLRRSCVSSARNAGESAIWFFVRHNPLRRSCVSSARNAGESAICPGRGRVECAKCRRECDLSRSGTTLCADRACRVREMQARVRFGFVAGNPLRGSCVSMARNAGESAIGELEDENWRLSSTTLVRGVSGELEDENWRLCSATLVRGQSVELEAENWRLAGS